MMWIYIVLGWLVIGLVVAIMFGSVARRADRFEERAIIAKRLTGERGGAITS